MKKNNYKIIIKHLFIENTNMPRRQSVRRSWQDENFEDRQQNNDRVFVIRVPEPEVINTHPHLEILHETNIKSVQREPSQTEKGEKYNKL